MKKKFIIFSLLVSTLFFLSFSYVNAADGGEMTQGIRNIVGGGENVVSDVAGGVTGAVKDGVNALENGGKAIVDGTKNTADNMMNNDNKDNNNRDNNRNNNNYTATRTATNYNAGTDNTSSMFTWFIVIITAAAIVTLIWGYSRERKSENKY